MILTTVATVAILPVAAPFLIGGVSTSRFLIARPLLLLVLLPLMIGLTVRWLNRDAADLALRPVTMLANAAGLVLLIAIVPLHGSGMVNAVGSFAIAAQLVFVAVVTVAAHLASTTLAETAQPVLTIGMCSRNLAAALAPMAQIEPDPRAIVMIAIAVPITLAASILAARRLTPRRAGFA
jgi:BASS family bile acid:Na+ symporter